MTSKPRTARVAWNTASAERHRNERRPVAAERDDDRLDPERAGERLRREPVRRGDHPVRRAEAPRAPEAEAGAHRHLARQPVVDARLGDDDEQAERERLAEHRRRDRPRERQAAVDDGERAQDVHDRVEEEREVDREEIGPADRPQLGRDRLDAVLLDCRHYAVVALAAAPAGCRLCRVKKSITTRTCSSVLSKSVEWLEPRDDVLLRARDALEDRLLAGAVRAPGPTASSGGPRRRRARGPAR